MYWEGGVDGGKTGDEVAFPCVNPFFCYVSAVETRGDALKVDGVFAKLLFEPLRTFVVQEVKDLCEAAVRKVGVHFFVGVQDGLGGAVFHWFR